MIGHRRIDPAEFERCVALLTSRIEALAGRPGSASGEYTDLQGALSALTPSNRGRAGVLLDGIALRVTDDDRAMAVAARYVRALAAEVWN
jgi:hypothetical protein